MAYVTSRSRWGRLGLVTATATKIDPGFTGCVTLEIVNEEHDALRAKSKIAYGSRIAASPLADLEDSIRLGWPSRYFIQITILVTVFPLIIFLDGQESEEEKTPGTPSLTLPGGIIPPGPP